MREWNGGWILAPALPQQQASAAAAAITSRRPEAHMGNDPVIVAGSIDSLPPDRLRDGEDRRARCIDEDPPALHPPHAADPADRGRVAPCRGLPMADGRRGDPRDGGRAARGRAEAIGGRVHGARAGAAGLFAWQPSRTGSPSCWRPPTAGMACLSGA
jgi:hypothetical protein